MKIEIGTYIDEVTQILKKTIVDPFAEVKKVTPFKIFLLKYFYDRKEFSFITVVGLRETCPFTFSRNWSLQN